MNDYKERLKKYVDDHLLEDHKKRTTPHRVLTGLNEYEQLLIDDHVKGAYGFVNKYIRGEDMTIKEKERAVEFGLLLEEVLNGIEYVLPLELQGPLYRGLSLPEDIYVAKIENASVFCNDGFMCTALEIEIAEKFMLADGKKYLDRIFFYFKIIKHSASVPIHDGVKHIEDGREHIFKRDTYFEIIGKPKDMGTKSIQGWNAGDTHIVKYKEVVLKELSKYTRNKLKVKGVIPGPQLHPIPNFRGILYVYNNCIIDLSTGEITLGRLVEISEQKNLYEYASNYITEENKNTTAFCFSQTSGIKNKEYKELVTKLVNALNLVIKPSDTLINRDYYIEKHGKEKNPIELKYQTCNNGWGLKGKLLELDRFKDKVMWIPQLAHL